MVNTWAPFEDTPTPTLGWSYKTDAERKAALQSLLDALGAPLRVVLATKTGAVVVDLLKTMPARQRGVYLLDIEQRMRADVDHALNLQLLPRGDMNALRKLRGVEVKEWEDR